MRYNQDMDSGNCRISIIVPVFRVEKFLDECVQSLVNQTFGSLEIILVDDGSDDASPIKCDEWAKKDSRIRCFHKVNGGLSSARNYGLERAVGDYILFVDSDDYLEANTLERCLSTIASTKCDTVIFTYWNITEDGGIKRLDAESETFPHDSVCSSSQALQYLLEDRFENYAWRIISPRKIWVEGNIRFPEGKLFEDIRTTYRIIEKSVRISFLNEQLYYYRSRQQSIMTTANYEQLIANAEAYKKRGESIVKKYPSLRQLANAELYKVNYRIASNEAYRISKDQRISEAVTKAEVFLRSTKPNKFVFRMLSPYQRITLSLIRTRTFWIIEPVFYQIRGLIRIVRFHSQRQ